jgi:hypothetical protein
VSDRKNGGRNLFLSGIFLGILFQGMSAQDYLLLLFGGNEPGNKSQKTNHPIVHTRLGTEVAKPVR